MHHALRDFYKRKASVAESVLILASVVFCATTFAKDGLYSFFGVVPETGRWVLGITSVGAFAAAILTSVFDWRGKAALHDDAAQRWSDVVRRFRETRQDDDTWPTEQATELSRRYWEAGKNSTPIPDRRFNRLKAAYLAKIELGKEIDRNPGASVLLLWVKVRLCKSWILLTKSRGQTKDENTQIS